MSGTSTDVKAIQLCRLWVLFMKKDSKHTFGAFAFGVSGFGVDFPKA
jgi:long-chain fatty acid transport protein